MEPVEGLNQESMVENYVRSALEGFLTDPPDNEFQRGFLSAMTDVYAEALLHGRGDALVQAAEKVIKSL